MESEFWVSDCAQTVISGLAIVTSSSCLELAFIRPADCIASSMGFWLGTLIFFLIQVVVTACVNFFSQTGNKGLNHILGFTAVFQCWLLWAIVYIAQMNPLIMPVYNE